MVGEAWPFGREVHPHATFAIIHFRSRALTKKSGKRSGEAKEAGCRRSAPPSTTRSWPSWSRSFGALIRKSRERDSEDREDRKTSWRWSRRAPRAVGWGNVPQLLCAASQISSCAHDESTNE